MIPHNNIGLFGVCIFRQIYDTCVAECGRVHAISVLEDHPNSVWNKTVCFDRQVVWKLNLVVSINFQIEELGLDDEENGVKQLWRKDKLQQQRRPSIQQAAT